MNYKNVILKYIEHLNNKLDQAFCESEEKTNSSPQISFEGVRSVVSASKNSFQRLKNKIIKK